MRLFVILLITLIPFNCFAFDEWSKQDIALQALYTGLHVTDWGQSRYITKHPDKYYEKNWVLGKYPSKDTVDIYFASTLVGHTLVTHMLPKDYRILWQFMTILVELSVVPSNFNMGVKVDF